MKTLLANSQGVKGAAVGPGASNVSNIKSVLENWQADANPALAAKRAAIARGHAKAAAELAAKQQAAAGQQGSGQQAVPGGNVTMAGWDASRTDDDPKMVFGRWAQQATQGGKIPLTGDMVRQFVSSDPRWEVDPNSSAGDPRIRVKQGELDQWKPGTSVYQDVIGDSGGAGRVQFMNAAGTGYGPGEPGWKGPGGAGAGQQGGPGGPGIVRAGGPDAAQAGGGGVNPATGQPYAGGEGGDYELASYMTNSPLMKPWTTPFHSPQWQPPPEFQAPTDITMQNDPGYQARAKLGEQAIQRSAAAKGTLLTGGTMRDLNQFSQDYASNEYGNVFNRGLTNYNTVYNARFNDWNTQHNKALQDYQQAYNIFEANQAKQYGRLSQFSGMGLNAANQLAQGGSSYAATASNAANQNAARLGDIYTGQGNATAAGIVGSQNEWNKGFGNAVNNLQRLPYYDYTRQGGSPGRQAGTGPDIPYTY